MGVNNVGDPDAEARSRTTDIYERIRDDVIRGHLAPGSRLKIEVLRERYRVGATPVREALSLLTADGLVARVEQRGFRVSEVSSSEFEELLAIRCSIEGRALQLAVARGGSDWEERVVLARYRLSRTPRDVGGDDTDWERCHKDFHMTLISGCGSQTLLRLCNQLYDENSRYRYVARLGPGARPTVYEEHERLAEVALLRDRDLAVQLLSAHYTATGDLLRVALHLEDAKSPGRGAERPDPAPGKRSGGRPAAALKAASE
jgi:GntR family transcriptional regulator, carbon starvation induced regulator